MKNDKATLTAYIATELNAVQANIIELNNQKNQKQAELDDITENIDRIKDYIKALKKINDDFEKEVNEILGNKETETHILSKCKEQVARIEKELNKIETTNEELENKIEFYNFLIDSVNEAQFVDSQKTVKSDVAIDYNKHTTQVLNIVGEGVTNITPWGALCNLAYKLCTIDIDRQLKKETNAIKIQELQLQLERVKLEYEKQDRQYNQNQEDIKNIKAGFANKYQGFINELFDHNGKMKPISKENADILRKLFEAEIKKDIEEYNKNETKFDKIKSDNMGTIDTLLKAGEMSKLKTSFVTKANEFQITINGLNAEKRKYEIKPHVPQTIINTKDDQILTEQLKQHNLIKLNNEITKQNPNIIAHNIENIENTKNEIKERKETSKLKLMNNNNKKTI
ncbi:hypothetical protein [Candidatus Phytoplasma sp. AldY-WA1]|uniref:hypothetical protein n=1 Tax=Candidatus Phytoplasma sp. AldY-WA1 TaxID=2852100 RepID=UPI00254F867A|nr:hypothetical protein [Candidatus Phytoplasma sp. AldY-WA1]